LLNFALAFVTHFPRTFTWRVGINFVDDSDQHPYPLTSVPTIQTESVLSIAMSFSAEEAGIAARPKIKVAITEKKTKLRFNLKSFLDQNQEN
jgi:hypothetical protein